MQDWTFHGGRLEQARKVFGDKAGPWLDLSTGINPHVWPGAADIAVDWRRLPDEGALSALEQSAADFFGADADQVCAVPGSEVGLRLLADLLPADRGHVPPCYRTHADIAPTAVPDLADIDHVAAAGRTIIIANPNNPDGRLLSPDRLRRMVAGMTGWLVVDEAFADAQPEVSVAPAVEEGVPLIVLRSFGKFFGLAGLRLGFVVAPRNILERLRARLGSWPLSAAAIAIGTAAYRDASWVMAMRTRLHEDAAALDAVLKRHGLVPEGASPLFRLVRTPDAPELFARLARCGILTRPFDHDPRMLRIGLPGSSEHLARLDAALGNG